MFTVAVCQLVIRFQTQKPSSNFKRWEPILYQQLVDETSFLLPSASIRQRLWHVENNTVDIPKCSTCGTTAVTWNEDQKCYRLYCGNHKCYVGLPAVTAAKKATMLEKYGVEHYTQAHDFNEKRQSTYRQNYGTEWGMQSPQVQQKLSATIQQKYNASTYFLSDDYKEKYQATLADKGVISTSQHQLSTVALNSLSSPEWITLQHHTNKRTITDIAEELNVDTTTVMSRLHNFNIQLRRFGGSQGQRDMYEYISSILDCEVRQNVRDVLPSGKELDIYIPSLHMAIEYCGLYWHSPDTQPRITIQYHKDKHDECTQAGIRLFTIFEDEWQHKQHIVKSIIGYAVQKSDAVKINARDCVIQPLTNLQASEFLDMHHIQGDGDGSIRIGLFHNTLLVAVCKVIRHNNHHVINRYATSCLVRGGFSKILKHLCDTLDWLQIVTFADKRWSNGELYGNTGFTVDKYLPPDYQYVNQARRSHKFNFRHSRLRNSLAGYNPNDTEVVNCLRAGLYRVWDCGKIRFVLDNINHGQKPIPQKG